jgi:hypothetical protein
MNVVDLMNVLAFGLACFSVGYAIGKDFSKSQK